MLSALSKLITKKLQARTLCSYLHSFFLLPRHVRRSNILSRQKKECIYLKGKMCFKSPNFGLVFLKSGRFGHCPNNLFRFEHKKNIPVRNGLQPFQRQQVHEVVTTFLQ